MTSRASVHCLRKRDAERLDKALALLWATHEGEGRAPWECASDGTRAEQLAKLLDQLIAQLREKRRALARPFERGSARILARGIDFKSGDGYIRCAADVEDDLIDAGEAIELAATRRGDFYERATRRRKL